VSPLDLSKVGGSKGPVAALKIGGGGGGGNPEHSDSPRTVKWRKENETREHMGLKPKVHPALKK